MAHHIIKCEILEAQPENRSVIARFWTDAFPEGSGWLNCTIWVDPIPQGDELIDYLIQYHAPRDWLRVKSDCAQQLPDMSSVQALVGKTHARDPEKFAPKEPRPTKVITA